MPWYRTITADQWRALAAAKLGWMLDAMDFMLYAMAIGQLRTYFGFNDATAGMLGTITLVMSGVGGVLFGYLADRIGRTRALMGDDRALLGGVARRGDIAERVSAAAVARAARHRHGRRMGVGRGADQRDVAGRASQQGDQHHAVGMGDRLHRRGADGGADPRRPCVRARSVALALPRRRAAGALHAVDPALRARAGRVGQRERAAARAAQPVFGDFRARPAHAARCSSSCSGASVQFAYWGIFFWLPAFLARPVAQGGAGMGVVGSLGWIIPVQIGAYFGYLTFGFIADRFGRRRTFILFMLVAAILVPIYGQMARSPVILMLLGPVLGYFGHGYFSLFGSFIAELFPTAVRATGQGTSYNIGRMAGAVAPYTIGAIATLPGIGIGLALGDDVGVLPARRVLIFTLPDRSGQALEA